MASPETKQYCHGANEEFEHLSDFIWKMNEQLDTLRRIELRKLDLYFPNDPEMRQRRWDNESRKLDYWFPIMLNYSSVVQVFITLETRLKKTCDLLYTDRQLPLRSKEIQGSPIEKHLTFLDKLCGVPKSKLTLWPQINVLTKIRDCVVHTSGFTQDSRDQMSLRNDITNRMFLSQQHRQWKKEREEQQGTAEEDEVRIISTELGDRLWIELEYSHTCCCYVRDFIDEIHVLADLK